MEVLKETDNCEFTNQEIKKEFAKIKWRDKY